MKIFGVAATLLLLASLASAGSVSASGEGWCPNAGPCDNTSTAVITNMFAGNSFGRYYNDFVALTLPSSHISSATISIGTADSITTSTPRQFITCTPPPRSAIAVWRPAHRWARLA